MVKIMEKPIEIHDLGGGVKPPSFLVQHPNAVTHGTCHDASHIFSSQPLHGSGVLGVSLVEESSQNYLSNEKNLGCLFDIEDYTTLLYGDYNKPI